MFAGVFIKAPTKDYLEKFSEKNDIAIKKGRKLSWEEVKALFKRGNDFNAKARFKYEFNEINCKTR